MVLCTTLFIIIQHNQKQELVWNNNDPLRPVSVVHFVHRRQTIEIEKDFQQQTYLLLLLLLLGDLKAQQISILSLCIDVLIQLLLSVLYMKSILALMYFLHYY